MPTNITPLVMKRSSEANKVPLVTDLTLGEIAVNTNDGKVYLKKDDGAESIIEVGPVYSVASRTGDITLTVADVADAAPLLSPALSGTPTAPTADIGTNTTQLATTAFVLGSAGAIVETIVNSNGTAIRWAGGMQVCFGSSSGTTANTVTNAFGSTSGDSFTVTVAQTFPAAFINDTFTITATALSQGLVSAAGISKTTTSSGVQLFGSNSAMVVTYDYIAFGMWI